MRFSRVVHRGVVDADSPQSTVHSAFWGVVSVTRCVDAYGPRCFGESLFGGSVFWARKHVGTGWFFGMCPLFEDLCGGSIGPERLYGVSQRHSVRPYLWSTYFWEKFVWGVGVPDVEKRVPRGRPWICVGGTIGPGEMTRVLLGKVSKKRYSFSLW